MAAHTRKPATVKPEPTPTPPAVADEFAAVAFVDVPKRKPSKPAPPPLTPGVKAIADKLASAGGPLCLAIDGWPDDKVKLLDKTLRGHRADLFPGKRIRITRATTDNGPVLKLTLGKLGK